MRYCFDPLSLELEFAMQLQFSIELIHFRINC